jgi:hypothetical protein
LVALRGLAVAVALIFGAAGATAATPYVVGGQLLGASDVDLDGMLYDVEFLDGTCVGLFSGCDEASDFTFQTADDAFAASQALLDQVFVDGASGLFGSTPDLTVGCVYPSYCEVITPYAPNGSSNVDTRFAINDSDGGDGVGAATIPSAYDTASAAAATYARWTAVPEPTTTVLFFSGAGLLFALRWSRTPR